MKHLAARLTNMDGRRPFTATGLGDRIHHCTVAWCYGPPVTLHLAERHVTGGQFGNKRESWDEIVSLFPPGAITIEVGGKGRLFRYGDLPAPTDTPEALDATPLLRKIPRLKAKPFVLDLPERFYTAQWDANGASRRVPPQPQDLPTVIVGGDAEGQLRWSLQTIAYAMSMAEGHVGVDSAFFHLAQLYQPLERIRIYHRDKLSHHVLRARANGAVCVRL